MLIWIFMVLDILVLMSISFAHFGFFFPTILLFMSSCYLAVKGAVFFSEPMSRIDLGIAFYVLLMAIFNFTTFLYYPIFAWFSYKLIFTIFS